MSQQRGFTLVMAIFILVVLGALAGYMVKLSGVQQATSVYAIQGARAYQAARAGIEWSISRIVDKNGGCAEVIAASPMTFADINGFSVTLKCKEPLGNPYTVGATNLSVYNIEAFGEFGNYSGAEYVSRRLAVSITHTN